MFGSAFLRRWFTRPDHALAELEAAGKFSSRPVNGKYDYTLALAGKRRSEARARQAMKLAAGKAVSKRTAEIWRMPTRRVSK